MFVYFFHVRGENSRSIGNSSSLPASISKISTSFAWGEKKLKFDDGPTSSSPGPTLLIVVATAVNDVIRSWLSNETIISEMTNIIVYATMNVLTERTVS